MSSDIPTQPYRERIADSMLAGALAALGAVLIEGPRACGKTETARRHAASEVLLDVDAPARTAADIDPALLLDGPVPRLLDEWQLEPRVWDAVRRVVDARRAVGQFVLTGSAAPIDDVRRHSGAGRVAVVRMRPMSLFELGASPGAVSVRALLDGAEVPPLRCDIDLSGYAERTVIGGWPALLGHSVQDASIFVRSWIDGVVEHDVQTATGRQRNPAMLRRFLRAYAQMTAHPVPIARIVDRAAGEADDGKTPSRWAAEPYLDALRRLMVVEDVDAWNIALRSRARLMTTPKRHLADPSLAAALMDCAPQRLLRDLRTFGLLFESLVTRDVRVYAEANDAAVFHYRERAGELEVDLIVERRDGAWIGLEVKLGGERAIEEAAISLRRLAESRAASAPAQLAVITAGGYAYRREDGVAVVPLGLLGP